MATESWSHKSLSYAVFLGLVCAACMLGLATRAGADTVYAYTGNDYNKCGGTYCSGGPYFLSVTFDTTLTGSALDNLAFTNISASIVSYKFTDPSGLTLDRSNNASGTFEIEISTDASGNIVDWFAGAYGPGANVQMQTNWHSTFGFIPGADFSETTASFAGNYGFVSDDPGTWSQVSQTPEPSTLLLTSLGVCGIVSRWRRRKSSC